MQLKYVSLYAREDAVYFHDCKKKKNLNEICTLLLIPHFSVHAGRWSAVPMSHYWKQDHANLRVLLADT